MDNKNIKIAFFDTKPYDRPSFEKYGKLQNVSFKFFEAKLNEDTAELAHGFDGVCAFVNDTVDAAVIDKLESLGVGVLALRCAGFNNVDMKHAYGKLHVLRVPAYSPYAVAEHTMALLLTSIRRIHKAYLRSRDFNFSLSGLVGFDLHGKTVGVIGTGRIGRAFIDICLGFGMKVLAYDKFPAKDLDNGDTIRYVELDELFACSDIISLHCPLTKETQHLINRNTIKIMKDGVYLVNTSRGALVDTDALIDALLQKKFGGVGLDVYEEEEGLFYEDFSEEIITDDNLARLMTFPNVLVTSHMGFFTKEAMQAIARTTLENAYAVEKGLPLDNRVGNVH